MPSSPKPMHAYVDGSTPSRRRGTVANLSGIGVVIHDARGLLLTIACPMPADLTSDQLEYRAILRALLAAREIGAGPYTVYCDSLRVVERIYHGDALPGCEQDRREVRRAANMVPFASVVAVFRDEVAEAHNLAQAARRLDEEIVTFRSAR